ncbi:MULTISPECIES: hypothetical protein [Ramlibacter]|uniref:Uncharacterized protein n=1 Tax=Ramlibacter aquaticus TaxID=2780094 RepID=A0ABR9SCI8_9BURK|nr:MULTISPECIES: hypothetical protein [Ramlibacter]MBE7939559.1 hypothetical protein [Ramlibacter aquaticus]
MQKQIATGSASRWAATLPSLEASDEFEPDEDAGYCPIRLLGAFTLLMAGHGRCVNTCMMLGDRNYAMWQLARAHTFGDAELREVAARLFAYFDDERCPVPAGLRA